MKNPLRTLSDNQIFLILIFIESIVIIGAWELLKLVWPFVKSFIHGITA